MQQSSASAPSSASSFAGMLAVLAGPAQRPASAWSDDELAEDVATLSYESALKARTRYRATDQSLTCNTTPEPFNNKDGPSSASAPSQSRMRAAADPQFAEPSDYVSEPAAAACSMRTLKEASITIRMSKAECAQLRKRAAEAGLTVSAYMRSCTFEAESLRAMVKEALAQLRSAADAAKPAGKILPRSSPLGKLAHFFSLQRGN